MQVDRVQYDLFVSEQVISPDGYLTNCTTINGQYPGPAIEADWGDTISRPPVQQSS
jgi:hypothetical protein